MSLGRTDMILHYFFEIEADTGFECSCPGLSPDRMEKLVCQGTDQGYSVNTGFAALNF